MICDPIKVFLVEDSPIALILLQRVLNSSPEVKVVGTAPNGLLALKQIPFLKPDIICTDFLMEKMDGLEFTKQLMSIYPLPILVISEIVSDRDNKKIERLIEAGVLDVFPKPKIGSLKNYEQQRKVLVQKLKILSGVRVFPKKIKSLQQTKINNKNKFNPQSLKKHQQYQIITIGVSTGGPQALKSILSKLPKNFPLPIICIQHISAGFLNSLIHWLNKESSLKVKIARSGETPLPRTVYFAPDLYHLELGKDGKFIYSDAPPVNSHRPAINKTFISVANTFGNKTIGIILTGMGIDGVQGMKQIDRFGGMTIAQDETSSLIFGMPQEAIRSGAVKEVLPLNEIPSYLTQLVEKS